MEPLLEQFGTPPTRYGDHRLTRIPGGFRIQGDQGQYEMGNELVGASALGAVLAAVLLGEKLQMTTEELSAFVTSVAGPVIPDQSSHALDG